MNNHPSISNVGHTDNLVSQINAKIADGMTQVEIAAKAGIGNSALNQWLQKKYKGDNKVIENALQRFLNSEANRSSVPQFTSNFIHTETASRIIAVFSFAQATGDVGVVYGVPGSGKTRSARFYQGQNANVWIVTCTPAITTPNHIMDEMCHVLGIESITRTLQMQRELQRRLMNTNGLIIIDEAQHLSVAALEMVRGLWDSLENTVGIVLMGNEAVYTRLTGGKRDVDFARLFSRLGKREHIKNVRASDAETVANAYGFVEKGQLVLCKEIAQKPGGLRGLVKTLRLAQMIALQTPTAADIKAAWHDLGGNLGESANA